MSHQSAQPSGVSRRTFLAGAGSTVGSGLIMTAFGALPASAASGRALRSPVVYHVASYGAFPGDLDDDTDEIRDAIACALADPSNDTIVQFDAGIYNLSDAGVSSAFLGIDGGLARDKRIRLQGAVDGSGAPATILQVNLPLVNEATIGQHLNVLNCEAFALENFVLDFFPRFSTAGEVVSVDANGDVLVDILPGQSHFDGMAFYSGNAWDLSTGRLLPIDNLTEGTNPALFTTRWQATGTPGRYLMNGYDLHLKVQPGDGISWHFQAQGPQHAAYIAHCGEVEVTNVTIHNSLVMGMLLGYNGDVTFDRLRIEPEGDSLAVGPRDGIHLSNNSGQLVVTDCYIAGVRQDPIVSRTSFLEIASVSGSTVTTDTTTSEFDLSVGDTVVFWHDAVNHPDLHPQVSTITSVVAYGSWATTQHWDLTFSPPLDLTGLTLTGPDPDVPKFSVDAYEWTSASITDSTFEHNGGTPLVFNNHDLVVTGCTFDNNMNHSIGLGTTSDNTGTLARHIEIAHNTFTDSTWATKYDNFRVGNSSSPIVAGTIMSFERNPGIATNARFNDDIWIHDNTFSGIGDPNGGFVCSAVYLRNAQQVVIEDNTLVGFSDELRFYASSVVDVELNGVTVA
jgi:hypothetical protein